MDFGFGAVLEYFEKYFGKRVTFAILVVLGLSIVAVGVSLIATWLVMPVLKFFNTPDWQMTIVTGTLAVLGIGAGISLSSSLTTAAITGGASNT